jgi:DnaJ-domain-containing protein 1
VRTSPEASGQWIERLARGEFVRLIYRLARTRATGVLTVQPPRGAADMLVLRRGVLVAAEQDPGEGSRRTAHRLERLAALEGARVQFDGGLAAYPPGGALRQYNLAAWARSHLESQLDAGQAQAMLQELAGARLALRPELVPELSWCDDTDRRILAAMAVPRRLDQIWPLARTARFRLLSFLYFLRAVGAVTPLGVSAPVTAPSPACDDAYRLLGVPSGADRETVKRAYRRLARALHPDMNAGMSEDRRRELERKLAAVNTAYRRLV